MLNINNSPLVRHIAYINFEKNPLMVTNNDIKIPAYMPLV